MNQLKNNLALVVAIAVSVVGTVAGILMILSISGRVEEQRASLSVIQQDIQGQLSTKGFLSSPGNVTIARQNTEGVLRTRRQYLEAFNNPGVKTDEVKPIEMKVQINTAVQTMAGWLKESKTIVPPAANGFSFEAYANVPPAEQNTPMLNLQLSVAKIVIKELARLKVFEIKSFKRVMLSNEPGVAGAPATKGFAIVENNELGYREIPFEVTFYGSSDHLREFLGFLASSKDLFVVRDVRIQSPGLRAPTVATLDKEAAAWPKERGPLPVFESDKEKLEITVNFSLLEFNENKGKAAGGGA